MKKAVALRYRAGSDNAPVLIDLVEKVNQRGIDCFPASPQIIG